MKLKIRLPVSLCIRGSAAIFFGFLILTSAAADQKRDVDPRANEMLKRMGEYLGKAHSYSVDAEIWQDVELSSGQRVQAGRNIKLEVRRPNRFHAAVLSTRRNRELFYDGKSITLFNRAQSFYGAFRAPGSLDKALDEASDKFGISMPLEDFITSNPYEDLIDNVISGIDIGPVNVMGVPCEHLAFSETNIDWQVWIEKGAKPVPRKFLITYNDEDGSPQFTAIFSHWELNPELPDFVFQFEPPPGASQIAVEEVKVANNTHKKEEK
jgi:hypothetical protein